MNDAVVKARPRRRRPRWQRWLGGGALALVVVLLLAEAVLRWGVGLGDPPLARLDPQTEYELVRSAEYERWGNRVSINSLGMRAPEPPFAPMDGDRRILLIGDSVVYGGHHLDQSETIAARMVEDFAGMTGFAGCRPVVLPVAVSSWGPPNQAAFLARDGLHDADVAALVVSAHDLRDVPNAGVDVPYRLSASRSAIGDAFEAAWSRYRGEPASPPSLTQDERLAAGLAALQQMADQLAGAGVPLVVAYHPTTVELAGGAQADADRADRDRLRGWSADNGLTFVDLSEGRARPDGYDDVIHPNVIGAARLADDLLGAIAPLIETC